MSPSEAHAVAVAKMADEANMNIRLDFSYSPHLPVDGAEEAIAAYLASLRASGYAVVPMEPTEEMVGAVLTYHSEATGISYEADFVAGAVRAALAAAPTFPPEADHA